MAHETKFHGMRRAEFKQRKLAKCAEKLVVDSSSLCIMDLGAAIVQKEAGSNSAELNMYKLQQFAKDVKDLVVTVVKQIDSIIAVLGEVEWRDQTQDPAVAFEIEQLKHAVRKLVMLCKTLVNTVKSLAKYASNGEMHADINSKLSENPPNTRLLMVFLNGIQEKIKRCSESAKDFVEQYEILVKEIKEKSDEQSKKGKQLQGDHDSKQKSAKSSKNWGVGIMASGGLTTSATIYAGAAATSFTPVAVPIALLVFAGTVVGTTYNTVVSANYYAAASLSKHYLDVLDKAAVAISEVHKKANHLKEQETYLKEYIKNTQSEVQSLEESASVSGDKLCQERATDWKVQVELMKDTMKELLAECAAIKWDP